MRYTVFQSGSSDILNIDWIGSAVDPSVTRFGPGVRNHYIIHYVFSGKGYFNGNQVSAGQGFLITPGMHEEYYPDEKDPWSFLWILSKDCRIKEIFDMFDADDNNIFSYDYLHKIKQMHTVLFENKGKGYTPFQMLETFFSIVKHQKRGEDKSSLTSNADIYFESAKKYISANISNVITVSELTSFLGVSQPYLYKIFIGKTSKSPKEFILAEKLDYTKSLLTETDISITHIAYSVGFQDVLMFSKFFKLKAGISPTEYRSQHISAKYKTFT